MRGKSLLPLAAAVIVAVVSGPVFADSRADIGKRIFKDECAVCHATRAGAHKMGPSMAGIYGQRAGGTDFRQYVGLKDLDFSWDAENLDKFLGDPEGFLGRETSMFSTMEDAQKRAEVIEYLMTLK